MVNPDVFYFLQNKEWYTTPADFGSDEMFFDDDRGYHLTDKAPQEAIDAYNRLYGEHYDEDGRIAD